MADISIDRLSINAPGTSQRGERLARLIADGLAAASPQDGSSLALSSLKTSLPWRGNESDEALADRIVAELLLRLDTTA
jgi:hypothetical protein